MNPLEMLRDRKEKRISTHVQKTANSTAHIIYEGLIDQSLKEAIFNDPEEARTDSFKIPVGRKPRGIQPEEYMNRVADNTLKILGSRGCDELVEYDHLASERASTHTVHYPEALVAELNDRNLQLVFKRPQ